MRKIVSALIIASFLAVILIPLFRMVHMRNGVLICNVLFSCCLFLGCVLSLVSVAGSKNKKNIGTSRFPFSKLSNIAAALCGIFLSSAHLLRLAHYPFGRIAAEISYILLLIYVFLFAWRAFSARKLVKKADAAIFLTSDELNRYVGIYFNEQLNMKISVDKNEENSSLIAQATGQSSFPLNAIGENIFNYRAAGLVMEFKPEDNQFALIQRGGYYTFRKEL